MMLFLDVINLPLIVVGFATTLVYANIQPVAVGIIENGKNRVHIHTEEVQHCNVTFHWHYVEMQEPFNIFRAVRILDNRSEVDFIIMFDNIKIDYAAQDVLKTENKDIIIWGQRPSFSLKTIRVTTQSSGFDACPVVTNIKTTRVPFCFNDSDIQKTNNGTRVDKVSLTAPAILSSLIHKIMHWTSVFVLHENQTETEAASLVDNLSGHGVLVVVYNVDMVNNLTEILIDAYNNKVSNFLKMNIVVACTFNCIRRVLHAANEYDDKNSKTLLKQISRWLIASYDHTPEVTETLRSCANDIDNVAYVALPAVQANDYEKHFRDDLQRLLLEYSMSYNESSETSEDIVKYMINTLKEKASAWMPVSKCKGLKIDTLMWKTHNKRAFNNVGYIADTGEVVMFSDLFPNTNFGYNRRQFLVSTLHYPPFVIKSEKNGTWIYEGMCMDLLKELAKTLNFTYNLTEPADKKWGSPVEGAKTLTFNGMIGQLQREEIDIVASDISIQKQREMVMDFAFPFYYGDTSVLLKKPDPNSGKWRTLVDPFKWQVLAAIGVTLPVVSLLAFALEKFNPFYTDPDNAKLAKETYGLHTFHDSFWYMYGALLSQGGVNLPESIAGRTFVSCWWLFSIVIVGTYCGNLIAFLTVTKDRPPFNTLEEMAELKNEYRWGLQAGTNWEYVFTTSTRKEFRAVGDMLVEFNKSDPSVMATDFSVQLANVQKGFYGWIGDTVIIEVEMAKDCNLMMIKERFLPLKYAFGFTNNSPHARIFSEQMLSIHESGLMQVWKRRWWPKSSICAGAGSIPEAKPISIVDVQSAFYVAAGGVVIGAIAFLIEVIVGYFMKIKRRRPMSKTLVESVSQKDLSENNFEALK